MEREFEPESKARSGNNEDQGEAREEIEFLTAEYEDDVRHVLSEEVSKTPQEDLDNKETVRVPLARLTPKFGRTVLREYFQVNKFEILEQAFIISEFDRLFYTNEMGNLLMAYPEAMEEPDEEVKKSHERTVRGSMKRFAETLREHPESDLHAEFDRQMMALYFEEEELNAHNEYQRLSQNLDDLDFHQAEFEEAISDQEGRLTTIAKQLFQEALARLRREIEEKSKKNMKEGAEE